VFVLVHEEDALHCAALALPLVLLLHPRESSLHRRILRGGNGIALKPTRKNPGDYTCCGQPEIHVSPRAVGRCQRYSFKRRQAVLYLNFFRRQHIPKNKAGTSSDLALLVVFCAYCVIAQRVDIHCVRHPNKFESRDINGGMRGLGSCRLPSPHLRRRGPGPGHTSTQADRDPLVTRIPNSASLRVASHWHASRSLPAAAGPRRRGPGPPRGGPSRSAPRSPRS
jgi:hypothetical protein